MDRGHGKSAGNYARRTGSVQNNTINSRSGLAGKQKETAQYLADMILELRVMAKSAQLFHVMVPLEYAYYEAFAAANKVAVPEDEVARLMELSAMAEQADSPPEDY